MEISQILTTENLGKFLATANGVFEVEAPGGEILRYFCRLGGSVEWVEFLGTVNPPPDHYRITKVSDQVPIKGVTTPLTFKQAAGT